MASCMVDKQTCNLYINIGGMAFAFFLLFLFLEGGGGLGERGSDFILFSTVKINPKKT